MAQAPTQASQQPCAARALSVDSDASSDSIIILTQQDQIDDLEELRNKKVSLGGRLSRPRKEYRYIQFLNGFGREYTDDDCFFDYMQMEGKYWRGELLAWESHLTRIRRRWERRHDAPSGTVPPPLPAHEMSPLALHEEYLELVLSKVRTGARKGAQSPIEGGWHFGRYALLWEHFREMKRVVEEMRAECGLTDPALLGTRDDEDALDPWAPASAPCAEEPERPRRDRPERAAPRVRFALGGSGKAQSRALATDEEVARGILAEKPAPKAAGGVHVIDYAIKSIKTNPEKEDSQDTVVAQREPSSGPPAPVARPGEDKSSRKRKRRGKEHGASMMRRARQSRRIMGLQPEYCGL